MTEPQTVSDHPDEQHPLEHNWTFYVQNKNDDPSHAEYQALCEFSTVEDFWRYFVHIPKPSGVFSQQDGGRWHRRRVDGKEFEAFNIFKEGIKPEWEDPANLQGGHWEYTRELDADVLDKMWTSIVLAVIGEVLEDGHEITGVRVVDRSRPKRAAEFRIELWTRTKNARISETIRGRLEDVLKESAKVAATDLKWKDHDHQLSLVKAMQNPYGPTQNRFVPTPPLGNSSTSATPSPVPDVSADGEDGEGKGRGRGKHRITEAAREKLAGLLGPTATA